MAHIDAQAIQNCTFCDTKTLGENLKLSKCQGKKGSDPALYVMDEKETEQFKCQAPKESQFRDVQETLGTLLLALNWPDWTDGDRATLLRCIDCLERKLIDIKQGGNNENPATGIENPR